MILRNVPANHAFADVIFLHGRGGSERDANRIEPAFRGASICAYRGPITEGSGFSWFLNRAIGVADEASLAQERVRVRAWIDAGVSHRKPWLCGFSNGAAMASSLALADPAAYAGLIMIAGCFVAEPLHEGGLDSMPVLFCRGMLDSVIPAAKFAQASTYLHGDSGARASSIDYAGGHELTPLLLAQIAEWFGKHARS
jgi:phospholipase/carboxylesterase